MADGTLIVMEILDLWKEYVYCYTHKHYTDVYCYIHKHHYTDVYCYTHKHHYTDKIYSQTSLHWWHILTNIITLMTYTHKHHDTDDVYCYTHKLYTDDIYCYTHKHHYTNWHMLLHPQTLHWCILLLTNIITLMTYTVTNIIPCLCVTLGSKHYRRTCTGHSLLSYQQHETVTSSNYCRQMPSFSCNEIPQCSLANFWPCAAVFCSNRAEMLLVRFSFGFESMKVFFPF